DAPIHEWTRQHFRMGAILGHNMDFDVNVLRRYGIEISSSIRDTMLAARLLGLGKEKVSEEDVWKCEILSGEKTPTLMTSTTKARCTIQPTTPLMPLFIVTLGRAFPKRSPNWEIRIGAFLKLARRNVNMFAGTSNIFLPCGNDWKAN